MRVTATRSGDWWAVEATHAGQPVYTQARRLDQIETMVRDAFVTLGLDIADEPVDVVPTIEGADLARRAREASKSAVEAAATASESMRKAVEGLQSQGLPVRDVAVMLGISPQRVSQIAASGRQRTSA
ncbi:MAG: antitoxin HicB [Dermatophilaceae bacterium]